MSFAVTHYEDPRNSLTHSDALLISDTPRTRKLVQYLNKAVVHTKNGRPRFLNLVSFEVAETNGSVGSEKILKLKLAAT